MRCHRHHDDDTGKVLARINQLLEQIMTDQEHADAIANAISNAVTEVSTLLSTLRAVVPAVPVDFAAADAAVASLQAVVTG